MAKKDTFGKDYLRQEEGHIVITLARREKINGDNVETLTMREPTVADWKRSSNRAGSEADKEIFGMANLCSVTPNELEAFSLRNFTRVQEAFALFTN